MNQPGSGMEAGIKLKPLSNVFIAYHLKDEGLLQRFEAHLSPLRWTDRVRTWSAAELHAGDHRRATVRHEIDKAAAVILLLSADFLSSDDCFEEVAYALRREAAGQTIVIPVLARACMWEFPPFSRLDVLPLNGTPVEGWPLPEQAWADVARSVAQKLGHLEAPRAQAESTEVRELQRQVILARTLPELNACATKLERLLERLPDDKDAQRLHHVILVAIKAEQSQQKSTAASLWAPALAAARQQQHHPSGGLLNLVGAVGLVAAGVAVALHFFRAPGMPSCALGREPAPEGGDAADLAYCVGVADGTCRTSLPPSGEITGSCRHEKMIGNWKSVNAQGQLLWSGSFNYLERKGRWEIHDSEKHISAGSYAPLGRDGTWTVWRKVGGSFRRLEGSYRQGKQVGLWKSFDPDDTLRTRTTFDEKGTLDGLSQFFCNGGLMLELSYVAGKVQDRVVFRGNNVDWRMKDGPMPEGLERHLSTSCVDKLPL